MLMPENMPKVLSLNSSLKMDLLPEEQTFGEVEYSPIRLTIKLKSQESDKINN